MDWWIEISPKSQICLLDLDHSETFLYLKELLPSNTTSTSYISYEVSSNIMTKQLISKNVLLGASEVVSNSALVFGLCSLLQVTPTKCKSKNASVSKKSHSMTLRVTCYKWNLCWKVSVSFTSKIFRCDMPILFQILKGSGYLTEKFHFIFFLIGPDFPWIVCIPDQSADLE